MRVRSRRALGLLLLAPVLLLLIGSPAIGQQEDGPTPADERLAWYDEHVEMATNSPFRNLAWQHLGPTVISGRITDVAVTTPRGNSYTIFVAGASGGVWRSKNEGTTWEPVFEHGPSTSIGDVTIAPSDQSVVWIGTGEANIFRSSMAGAGVFKSTDGGDNFEFMGLPATHTIPRIVIHPTDADTVWVAASGHEWTDNPERGVYKTTDGGSTWAHVFYANESTGAIDLVIDPSNPETLYMSTWQRVRKKWNDPRSEEGYTGSSIYKSTDGGASWNPINEGLPDPQHRGRIGIDVARSNPNVVYAFIDNYDVARMPDEDATDAYGRPLAPVIKAATVFRSDDGGASWTQTSENNRYMETLGGTYGWVFGQIRVDPNDENKIYVMGLALNVSEDSGKSFRRLTGMHGDHHGLWIDPDNSDYMVNTNDGGAYVTYDGGENWRHFTYNPAVADEANSGLPLVQFFNVGYDMNEPFLVYGSVQDHGSFRGAVDLSGGRHNIPVQEWERAPGGEGSTHQVDPTDPDTVYSAGFYGNISRTNMATGESTNIMPETPEGEPPLRGQWIAPFLISPHNPNVVYHGLNMLFRTTDRGESWEQVSPDLTYNELDKIGDIPYQTIYSITESPLKYGLIYVGTDDGRVWATEGPGPEGWAEITGELPQGKVIAASMHDLDTVYAVQNGKRDDDFRAYVWKSTDRGITWRDLSGIPSGPVNVIKEDPTDENILYVGTDLSAYVTLDGGANWHVLGGSLPSTFVQDMILHPRDDILVAATHGRGMWALDVRPIRAAAKAVAAGMADVVMFEPEDVRLPRRQFGFFFGGGGDAYLSYWLGGAADDVQVVISDIEGNELRTMEGTGDVGFNAVRWNLSAADGDGPDTGFGFRGRPRPVDPGIYTITVKAGGHEASTTLKISG
jgi:photosystem II stability/assembly factor-like uncharacterized protein